MSTANVAGVGVDTRHWIGGRRAASASTFTDVSPIDEQPIAEVARGGTAEVTRAGPGCGGGRAARFLERAAALRQGDPRDQSSDIGPTITRAHLDRVDGFVRRAVAARARPLLGGTVNHDLGGLYYRPTLLAGAKPGSEILTEEVFGPVLTLQTFHTEDEAVAMANSTRYGLAATMFTGDRERAERVSARLVAGTVWVNCFFVRDLRAPFGGAGLSGIGREGGTWSFDFYADVKNTVYAPEGWRSDG